MRKIVALSCGDGGFHSHGTRTVGGASEFFKGAFDDDLRFRADDESAGTRDEGEPSEEHVAGDVREGRVVASHVNGLTVALRLVGSNAGGRVEEGVDAEYPGQEGARFRVWVCSAFVVGKRGEALAPPCEQLALGRFLPLWARSPVVSDTRGEAVAFFSEKIALGCFLPLRVRILCRIGMCSEALGIPGGKAVLGVPFHMRGFSPIADETRWTMTALPHRKFTAGGCIVTVVVRQTHGVFAQAEGAARRSALSASWREPITGSRAPSST